MQGPLISDLDGTIADTAPAIYESLHVTCAVFDIPLALDADLTFALGPPLHWVLTELGFSDELMNDAIAVFETAHTQRLSLVVPMPGAGEVLSELARRGIQVGVATIKPEPIAVLVLEELGLRPFVTSMHARSGDMDPRTKTDLVRAALNDLDGDSPLYTGDHAGDEIAAKECEIPFLRYPEHSWAEIRAAVLSTDGA